MKMVTKWFRSLNDGEKEEGMHSFLAVDEFPPLPPFCPELPGDVGLHVRPQLVGPYAKLPRDMQTLREVDGSHQGLVWLVAHFLGKNRQHVELFLTRPAHKREKLLCFLTGVLTVSKVGWHTPLIAPCQQQYLDPEDSDDDDDDDQRLSWNSFGPDPGEVSLVADRVLLWALLPCGAETLQKVFPHTMELESGEKLYHGSYAGPDKFSGATEGDQMWFSHLPCPELNLGGFWNSKDGITWSRPHVYVYDVKRSIRLLDLTRLDEDHINVTPGIRGLIKASLTMGGGEAVRMARLTGTSPEAKLMARWLVNELLTGRVSGLNMDEILPRWLPRIEQAEAGHEDWDAEALSEMCASHFDGWYGCDYAQSSLQREVVLWGQGFGEKIQYVGREGANGEVVVVTTTTATTTTEKKRKKRRREKNTTATHSKKGSSHKKAKH